jgi:hypothetical protein
MIPFDEAWVFLKADESYTGQPKFGGNQKQPLDMVEYPEGSGNFMSLRDMLEARNAQSRANLAQLDENLKQGYIRKPNVAVTPSKYPSFSPQQQTILTHASGRYDPNNPDAMHPMGSGQ